MSRDCAHQMAIDATKSARRDEAEEMFKLADDDPDYSEVYELCGKLMECDLD